MVAFASNKTGSVWTCLSPTTRGRGVQCGQKRVQVPLGVSSDLRVVRWYGTLASSQAPYTKPVIVLNWLPPAAPTLLSVDGPTFSSVDRRSGGSVRLADAEGKQGADPLDSPCKSLVSRRSVSIGCHLSGVECPRDIDDLARSPRLHHSRQSTSQRAFERFSVLEITSTPLLETPAEVGAASAPSTARP